MDAPSPPLPLTLSSIGHQTHKPGSCDELGLDHHVERLLLQFVLSTACNILEIGNTMSGKGQRNSSRILIWFTGSHTLLIWLTGVTHDMAYWGHTPDMAYWGHTRCLPLPSAPNFQILVSRLLPQRLRYQLRRPRLIAQQSAPSLSPHSQWRQRRGCAKVLAPAYPPACLSLVSPTPPTKARHCRSHQIGICLRARRYQTRACPAGSGSLPETAPGEARMRTKH